METDKPWTVNFWPDEKPVVWQLLDNRAGGRVVATGRSRNLFTAHLRSVLLVVVMMAVPYLPGGRRGD